MSIKYKFFWQSSSPFSNWYTCVFTHNGITFTSSEQAMMFEKAKFFKDADIQVKVLETDSPRDQKALGRKISNFNAEQWDSVKYQIVKSILKAKFEQNPPLMNQLVECDGQFLVEASPYDRIWGIGYLAEDALDNIDNWGENLLGRILTEIMNEYLN